ncbi:MAG: hypothetical protein BalsKO_21420 [Balneolaceae bacterium]
MLDAKFTYSEDILQWIWKNLLFDTANLLTTCGKSITIFDPGTINVSDGPDFLNAKLMIDGLIWHGAVEIHLTSSGWRQHRHHLDKAYNKVVLHVVVEDFPKSVFTKNREELPTLNLLPHLPKHLSDFISEFDQSEKLPCSNNVRFISEEAFLAQIDKAHKEYLEKKGNDFLSFYSPELVPSKAWKYALVLSIFDGFGITHNRKSMQEVGAWFLECAEKSKKPLLKDILEFAGFGTRSTHLLWKHKGVFPANHPKKRINQALKMALKVLDTPFEDFLKPNCTQLWHNWVIDSKLNGVGRLNILYGTVYIPALYMLGNLFASTKISQISADAWNQYRVPIPKYVLKEFETLKGINRNKFSKKLGSVHQLNAYCHSRQCHKCFVLKKVILS